MNTQEYIEYLINDLFASLSNITSRAMFGGYALYVGQGVARSGHKRKNMAMPASLADQSFTAQPNKALAKTGKIFAIVINQQLYLKADEELAQKYTAAGARPFTYQRNGKTYSMKYFCPPEGVLENQKLLLQWVEWSCSLPSKPKIVSKRNA